MSGPTLTIGIPTYGRCDAVVANLESLIEQRVVDMPGVEVVVSDNHSTDGTWPALQALAARAPVRVMRNDSNIGVVRNILRLFDECRSDYLLITSDEDHIVGANVPVLRRVLAESGALFVSPQMHLKGRLYRGREQTADIEPADWWGTAFYISGLVYKVAETRAVIARIGEFIHDPNQLYFQNLLVAELLLVGRCMWWGEPIARGHVQLPTLVNENRTDVHYGRLPSRWAQYLETDRYLTALVGRCEDTPAADAARVMQSRFRRGFIHNVRQAIRHERPYLLDEFDAGMRAFALADVYRRHPYLRVVIRILERLTGRSTDA